MEHKLTLEKTYCENWKIGDAIRELIQNAIDTNTKVRIEKEGDYWIISDNGKGIKLQDFLIGRTSKADDSTKIGQFGEGLSIGSLVLARLGVAMFIDSLDSRYTLNFKFDNNWQSDLLTINVESIPYVKGTKVYIKCDNVWNLDEQIEYAKSLFLKFNPVRVLYKRPEFQILASEGDIYVNGLKVSPIDSLFSYNFIGQKNLVNRDRSSIGYSEIVKAISNAIEDVNSIDIIRHILQAARENSSFVECNSLYFHTNYRQAWKRAAYLVFGTKLCLAYSPTSDLAAIDHGYTLVDIHYSLKNQLSTAGIKFSRDVARNRIRRVKLSEVENIGKYKQARNYGRSLCKTLRLQSDYRLKLVEYIGDEGVMGTCNHGSESITLNVELLKLSFPKLLGVLIHERIHESTHTVDSTRQFENVLTDIIGKLGEIVIVQEQKIAELENHSYGRRMF